MNKHHEDNCDYRDASIEDRVNAGENLIRFSPESDEPYKVDGIRKQIETFFYRIVNGIYIPDAEKEQMRASFVKHPKHKGKWHERWKGIAYPESVEDPMIKTFIYAFFRTPEGEVKKREWNYRTEIKSSVDIRRVFIERDQRIHLDIEESLKAVCVEGHEYEDRIRAQLEEEANNVNNQAIMDIMSENYEKEGIILTGLDFFYNRPMAVNEKARLDEIRAKQGLREKTEDEKITERNPSKQMFRHKKVEKQGPENGK